MTTRIAVRPFELLFALWKDLAFDVIAKYTQSGCIGSYM